MLLKKDQVSPDLLKFFGNEILDQIRDEITRKFNIKTGILSPEIENKLKAIVKVKKK
jgi:hypothetical protein